MVSKEEYEKLEKRVADLEKKVQDQLSIEEFKKALEEVKEQMIIQVEELYDEGIGNGQKFFQYRH